MQDKFKNKYRIDSARLRHWDYGWNAIMVMPNHVHVIVGIGDNKFNTEPKKQQGKRCGMDRGMDRRDAMKYHFNE